MVCHGELVTYARTVADGLRAGWRLVTTAAAGWLLVAAGYLVCVLTFGRRPARPRQAPAMGPAAVVLVPAHDEAAGIEPTLAALLNQAYRPLEVIVIADNCSDETAAVAAATGVTVWEREDPTAPGKGPALAWALERLWHERTDTEVVIVVDADCDVSGNLCAALIAPIASGEADAAQARYEVANATQAPAAALRAVGFTLKHVIRARGRARLGLSCGLFGTGMAFSRGLLHEVAWADSVTEDTELFVRIVRHGGRIAYAEEAVVRSAMPITDAGAREQQLRWETGNAELARRELLALAAEGLRARRGEVFGLALELAQPSQSLMATAGAAVTLVGVLQRRGGLRAAGGAVLGAQVAYVGGGVLCGGGPRLTRTVIAHAPAFVATKLGVLGQIGSGRGARTWVRTERETAKLTHA